MKTNIPFNATTAVRDRGIDERTEFDSIYDSERKELHICAVEYPTVDFGRPARGINDIEAAKRYIKDNFYLVRFTQDAEDMGVLISPVKFANAWRP